MSGTAFRLKTGPELLANMMALHRLLRGLPSDFNVGAAVRTFYEVCALQDADQYVQISKVLKIFPWWKNKGDDLDRRFLEFGSAFFPPLRRLAAAASRTRVRFGDGTLVLRADLAADVAQLATSFTVVAGQGAQFPSSGAVNLEETTPRAEQVAFVRAGDVFSIVTVGGAAFPHLAGGSVVRISLSSVLASPTALAAMSGTLATNAGAAWPASGNVVLDRGNSNRELLAFTRSADVLTFGTPAAFAHAAGATAVLSTFGSDRVATAGQQVDAPATLASREVDFKTLADATLFDGDYASNLVDVVCLAVGVDTNVGSGTISAISSSPWANATVTNPAASTGGRNREEDDDYVARGLGYIFSLSGETTARGIAARVLGLQDPTSGRTVAFSQVVEPVSVPGPSILYVTDGSTDFSPSYQTFVGRDVAISDAVAGDRRGKLGQVGPYTIAAQPLVGRTPRLFLSIQRGTATSVGVNYLEDSSNTFVVNAYAGMYLKTDDDQFYLIASNSAIRFTLTAGGATPASGSYAVLDLLSVAAFSGASSAVAANSLTDGAATWTVNQYVNFWLVDASGATYLITANSATVLTLSAGGAVPAAGAFKIVASYYSVPMTPGVDYQFNESNGDLELTNPLLDHDAVVAASDGAAMGVGAYTYATGLLAVVQRTVNGDPTDFTDFPGLKSTGNKVVATAPVITSPTFLFRILAKAGASQAQLISLAQSVAQAYINSTGVGSQDGGVVLSEIVRRVKEIPICFDVTPIEPSQNVRVPDGQMVRVNESQVVFT